MFGMIPFVKAAGKGLGKFLSKDKNEAEEALKKEVENHGLDSSGLDIRLGDDGTVDIKGEAASQEMKEKIILAVGNIEGIEGVKDGATAKIGGRESNFHTVVSGDTLSAISKKYYGTWKLYPEIFEANKPMLSDPDKIYPGQVLRIPALKTDNS